MHKELEEAVEASSQRIKRCQRGVEGVLRKTHFNVLGARGKLVVDMSRGDVCNRGMRGMTPTQASIAEYFHTLVLVQGPNDLAFYKWLIELSCWSDMFPYDVCPEPDSDGHISLLIPINQPSTFLAGALIALRTPREAPDHVVVMYKLMADYGINGNYAYLLGLILRPKALSFTLSPHWRNGQHSPVDIGQLSLEKAIGMLDGKAPSLAGKATLKEKPMWTRADGETTDGRHLGVHAVWEDKIRLPSMYAYLEEKLTALATITRNTNTWGDTVTLECIDPDKVIKLIDKAIAAYKKKGK